MFEALAQAARNPFALLPLIFAAVFFFIAAYLAVVLYRREKKADERLKQARADITDMTILFQTMRDIIGQQKKLAREFNDELEHKMGQVKHILNQGMEKNKQLYEKQQRIAADLEEAQAQIDAIYRQVGQTGNRPDEQGPPAENRPVTEPARAADVMPPATTPRPPSDPAPRRKPMVNGSPATQAGDGDLGRARPLATPPRRLETPPPMSAAERERLADTGVTKSSFTSWIAEDLGARAAGEAGNPAPAPAGGIAPESEASPANGDAARAAFRALLNMPAETQSAPRSLDLTAPMDSVPAMPPPADPETDGHGTTAMQQRVLEYSEAGMTVAEVSRELGIGKGEVRLMLSLAKQNAPRHV